MSSRVGFGFDVHRFCEEKECFYLAGVKIDCGFGVKSVSDGDVLLHALADSFLGAAGLGDIGDYFPPQDVNSKDLSSKFILDEVLKKIGKSWQFNNSDITIIAQKPKLVSHKKQIISSLASMLSTNDINLKIKSKEHLDIFGGSQAIACFCVTCLDMNGR
jgi:2-C-methyl-D-erythritol 2,4-cyclodiphosphate synthase